MRRTILIEFLKLQTYYENTLRDGKDVLDYRQILKIQGTLQGINICRKIVNRIIPDE